ncbi:MAG: alpha/beta hydrolase [Deltaproteobacteria bacterium]|nr:alpha/beta hydrolase [Deltaproteobacteria bacterium]
MPIFDKSKIRKDVLQIIERNLKIQAEAGIEYAARSDLRGIDLQECMRRVVRGNKKYFENLENGRPAHDQLRDTLTHRDMVQVARLFRFAFDRLADYYLNQPGFPPEIRIDKVDLDGIPAEWQVVGGSEPDRVLLYFHGGGQVMGSTLSHRWLTAKLGEITGMRVLSVEYRLAPEHPFPAGVEDSFRAYRWLLEQGVQAEHIVIGGDSAGGNQAIATLLQIRDARIASPAGAFVLSPAIDYTTECETIYTNRQTDHLSSVGVFWWDQAYLAGADPRHPLISPVHAALHGLPPLLIQVTTNEIVYDHSTRLAERAAAAGVDVTLQQWDGLMHVWQHHGLYELPESKEALNNIKEFVERVVG